MEVEFTHEQQFLRESVRGTVDREAWLARLRDDRIADALSIMLAGSVAARAGASV